jgi:hypothetical protein
VTEKYELPLAVATTVGLWSPRCRLVWLLLSDWPVALVACTRRQFGASNVARVMKPRPVAPRTGQNKGEPSPEAKLPCGRLPQVFVHYYNEFFQMALLGSKRVAYECM